MAIEIIAVMAPRRKRRRQCGSIRHGKPLISQQQTRLSRLHRRAAIG
jgi:hypothetical protein